jgi:hypothetical protein
VESVSVTLTWIAVPAAVVCCGSTSSA